MARGKDTRNHPNRGVSKNMFPFGGGEEHGYVAPDNFQPTPKRRNARDNAPAGGIQRPEMESCVGCGQNTPKGSGSCADCK
jgi:hypothetical protein